MNHLKFKLPIVTLLVVIALVPMLYRQAHAEGAKVNWDSLNLTEEQREQLNSMDMQWKSSVHQIAPRLENNQRRLKLLMNESSPDESEVMDLQQQVHDDKLKLKMKATKLFLQKKKVLSPEQQVKLNRMMHSPSDTGSGFSPASASPRR